MKEFEIKGGIILKGGDLKRFQSQINSCDSLQLIVDTEKYTITFKPEAISKIEKLKDEIKRNDASS